MCIYALIFACICYICRSLHVNTFYFLILSSQQEDLRLAKSKESKEKNKTRIKEKLKKNEIKKFLTFLSSGHVLESSIFVVYVCNSNSFRT